jgi:C1A family cysteine protease
MIQAHNAQNDATWFMKLNQFSDLSDLEMEDYMGLAQDYDPANLTQLVVEESHGRLQQGNIDWRPYMNPVKDQGQCGSCYAFAATATMEGRYAIKRGVRVALSEQVIVDCSAQNNGCDGGLPSKAFVFI